MYEQRGSQRGVVLTDGLDLGLVAALHCVLHDEGRYSTVDWREGTVPRSQCCSSQDTGPALPCPAGSDTCSNHVRTEPSAASKPQAQGERHLRCRVLDGRMEIGMVGLRLGQGMPQGVALGSGGVKLVIAKPDSNRRIVLFPRASRV